MFDFLKRKKKQVLVLDTKEIRDHLKSQSKNELIKTVISLLIENDNLKTEASNANRRPS